MLGSSIFVYGAPIAFAVSRNSGQKGIKGIIEATLIVLSGIELLAVLTLGSATFVEGLFQAIGLL
jgi:hypothetical protein